MNGSDSIHRVANIDPLLDELLLLPPPFDSLKPIERPSLDSALTSRPQHRCNLRAPFVSRYPITRSARPERIEQVCQWLNHVGGGIVAPAESLSHISVSSAPLRIAPIFVDSWPDLVELESADAIELQCFAPGKTSSHVDDFLPAWPMEATTKAMLAKKIDLVRRLTDDQVPVGIASSLGRVQRDIPFLIEIGVDFLSLIVPRSKGSATTNHGEVVALAQARLSAEQAGRPRLPILCSASFRNGHDCAKLLGLGASGLLIDEWFDRVNPERPPERELASYYLMDELSRSIARGREVSHPMGAGSDPSSTLKDELLAELKRCGVQQIPELRSALAAATPNAAAQTGLPLICS